MKCQSSQMFFIYLIFFMSLHQSRGEKIIINADAGADDAIAILMLLRHESSKSKTSAFEIIGITCSYGNIDEEQVETNILKTLSLANRSDIPVFGGAKKALTEQVTASDNYFGSDGFGDAKFDRKITAVVNKSKHAAVALIDMARENSGNVSVVSLGPLTNIGLAIALDDDFTKHVKHFYIMGGSVAGIGYIRPNVEYNIGADPESNFMLFNAVSKAQITMIPWETALKVNLTKKWRNEVLGKYDSPYTRFLNKIEAVSLVKTSRPQWVSADTILAACLLEPSLITSSVVKNVYPVTDGVARGSLLVDYTNCTGRVENTKIVQKINETFFSEMLIRYLTCNEIPC